MADGVNVRRNKGGYNVWMSYLLRNVIADAEMRDINEFQCKFCLFFQQVKWHSC